MTSVINKKSVFLIIAGFGLISLLGDIIYEGARSINGPYLKLLGSTALNLGLIIGIGEFLGYAIRLLSGYLSDKTKSYWIFIFIGYGLLMSIPLLAFTNTWQIAATFIILERIGKGLRSPSKSTVLSYAVKQIGTGFGFGIVELLDQIGATIGPLIFAISFQHSSSLHNYHRTYNILWIPYVLLILTIFALFIKFKKPETMEKPKEDTKIPKIFWLYTLFSFFTTAGFVGFAMFAYHIKKLQLFSDSKIAFLYALAMLVDALFAVLIGKLYDRIKAKKQNEHAGVLIMLFAPILTILSLYTGFSSSSILVIIGISIWGIVMSMHETVMKAATADITHISKRARAYGFFTVVYGVGLLFANSLAGLLYSHSVIILAVVLSMIELISIPVFIVMKKELR